MRQNRSSNARIARHQTVDLAGAGGPMRSLRQRVTIAASRRSRDSSTEHSSALSHSASAAWSSSVDSGNLYAARISDRCRVIARPA
ncbi:hypothetical protein C0Q59_20445 [Streptomyces albidoflavus]|nr:hypothetical protein C0Q59_20445 [Streptomyces albidoflavus]